MRSCRASTDASVNLLGQWEHWNGRSPVCTRRCLVNMKRSEKRLPHWAHWCGRSPVCVARWRLTSERRVYVFSQCGHLNWLLARCVCRCWARASSESKASPHCRQTWRRADTCDFRCSSSSPGVGKPRPQMEQICGRRASRECACLWCAVSVRRLAKELPHGAQGKETAAPWCLPSCFARSHECWKVRAHREQRNGRSPVCVSWWRRTSDDRVNVLPHVAHGDGVNVAPEGVL
ncbi:hypothetical protein EYF80_026603 [Liparis tanakae]|uniref:Uncharacterized protein n=1 Tax=Liparis tanakae TaxID=230148 RepID=A0A4Z2HBE5_9TELE|nr:hypothetical protein EYF80_026603 [Liparis tanakae]